MSRACENEEAGGKTRQQMHHFSNMTNKHGYTLAWYLLEARFGMFWLIRAIEMK